MVNVWLKHLKEYFDGMNYSKERKVFLAMLALGWDAATWPNQDQIHFNGQANAEIG